MRPLFLSSVFENSGKSMVALGLAKNYKGKVGYYKPFREDVLCIDNRVVDRDAYLMKHVLDLEPTEEMLSPLKYDIFSPVSMDAVTAGYERVKGDAEFMIVESPQLFTTGALHRVEGVSIAQAIGADIVLIATDEPDALDKVAHHARLMEKAGIKLSALSAHAPLCRPEVGTEYLKQAIRFAAECGAPVVNTDEGPKPAWTTVEQDYTLMCYTLHEAAALAEKYSRRETRWLI